MIKAARALRRQGGFGIVELMIGLTLGLVIIGAAIVVFSSSRVSSVATKEQGRLEDAARYVQRMMQSSVGQAGYFGCVSRGAAMSNLLNTPTAFLYNFAQPIYGSTGNGTGFSPALDASLPTGAGAPDSKSDVLVIRGANWKSYPVLAPYPAAIGSTALTVAQNTDIKAGTIVGASNCTKTVVFEHTGTGCGVGGACALGHAATTIPAPGNASANLGFAFGADTEVVTPVTTVYYVANSARCQGGAQSNCPMGSLWRQEGGAAAQEMVEGVDSMKIIYRVDNGIRGGGKSMTGAAIQTAALWGSVVGLEANFTLSTLAPVAASGTQTVNSVNYTDRRVRRFVTAAVSFRNSAP